MNPLERILRVTKKDRWYSIDEFCMIVGFQLIAEGFEFKNSKDLLGVAIAMHQEGFIEADENDHRMVRPRECFFESI